MYLVPEDFFSPYFQRNYSLHHPCTFLGVGKFMRVTSSKADSKADILEFLSLCSEDELELQLSTAQLWGLEFSTGRLRGV